jgi:hypothetical protein
MKKTVIREVNVFDLRCGNTEKKGTPGAEEQNGRTKAQNTNDVKFGRGWTFSPSKQNPMAGTSDA